MILNGFHFQHELRDLFEGCGEIVEVVILDNSNGQPYG
jgi:hypothetical protein